MSRNQADRCLGRHASVLFWFQLARCVLAAALFCVASCSARCCQGNCEPSSPSPASSSPPATLRNGACNLALAPGVEPSSIPCFRPPVNPKVDVRLFVVGLNHQLPDAHKFVDQAGVDALASFIAGDEGDPDNIIVAISSSNWPAVGTLCDAGDFRPAAGSTLNGHCLAQALKARMGDHFEIVSREAPRLPGEYKAGTGLIVGRRWKPLDSWTVGPGCETADASLAVMLKDTQTANGDRFTIYVVHTCEDDAAAMDLQAFARDAVARQSSDELAPLFVGDFNFPNCGGLEDCSTSTAAMMRNDFLWANREPLLHCPGVDGRPDVDMDVFSHDSLMHALIGCRQAGATFNFACTRGQLVPVRVMFTADEQGMPTRLGSGRTDGIEIPIIRHDSLGLGLSIQRAAACGPGQKCYRGACVADCDCRARGGTGHRCDQVDACGNQCRCISGYACEGGQCQPPDERRCGSRTCSPGSECCDVGARPSCCNAATETCTIRGCARRPGLPP